ERFLALAPNNKVDCWASVQNSFVVQARKVVAKYGVAVRPCCLSSGREATVLPEKLACSGKAEQPRRSNFACEGQHGLDCILQSAVVQHLCVDNVYGKSSGFQIALN